MANRPAKDADGASSRSRAIPVLTLLLALYAAGAATLLLLRSPTAPASAGTADVTPQLQAALDEHARRLRGEIAGDFKKAVDETKGQVNEAVRRLDERSAALQSLVDAAKRGAEGLAKVSATRAELIEDRLKEVTEKNVEARRKVDALALAVRELERRPVAGPAPAAPAPVPETPEPAAPAPAPEGPKGPSPEELAANKAKVRALLPALEGDLRAALPAATELGRLGDLEAVEPLTKMLQHRDVYARTAAAEALGTLRACDAVPALINALLDKDPGVFLQAGVALRRILGLDSQLSGDSSRKDRSDARDRALRFWRDNEATIRERLGQPAKVPAPPEAGK
jgi:hypothetical protein